MLPINELSSECKSNQKCFGGIARTVTKVNEILNQQQNTGANNNVLFLNGGDHFQGTVWYTIKKWQVVAQFVKLFKHDAMALGNHEFDDGVAGLLPFVKNVTNDENDKPLPIVCANIVTSGELRQLVKPSIVVERVGKKIAIIGYITPDTKFLARPGSDVTFTDEIQSIRQEITRLKQNDNTKDINIFIAVGHSGFEKDKEIAAQIPELDIVVGGHSNTFLYTGTPIPSIEKPEGEYPVVFDHQSNGKTLVVQAFAYGKYLGKLDVQFDENGIITGYSGNPILLDSKVPEDAKTRSLVESVASEINAKFNETVGYSRVLLDSTQCREKECNCGNLFADAFVDYFMDISQEERRNGWTTVPIAIVNGGAVRNTISDGNITMKDIMSTAPFGNKLGVLNTSGANLWKILEHSASSYKLGGFLQVSGIRYTLNPTLPTGKRLLTVRVRCGSCMTPVYEDIDLNAKYSIALTEYLAHGGDNYTMINETEFTAYEMIDNQMLSDYIETHSPIITGIEDRIIIDTDNHNEGNYANTRHSSINLIYSSINIRHIRLLAQPRKSRGHIIIIGGSGGGGKTVEEKIVHVPVPYPIHQPCPMHKASMIMKYPMPVHHHHHPMSMASHSMPIASHRVPVAASIPVPKFLPIPIMKQVPIVKHVPVFQPIQPTPPPTQQVTVYQKIPVYQKETTPVVPQQMEIPDQQQQQHQYEHQTQPQSALPIPQTQPQQVDDGLQNVEYNQNDFNHQLLNEESAPADYQYNSVLPLSGYPLQDQQQQHIQQQQQQPIQEQPQQESHTTQPPQESKLNMLLNKLKIKPIIKPITSLSSLLTGNSNNS
ncbi:5'-nucleotidase-like [Oppia nitens]|uniref:5'-nucleotidase-like n=1 Tax=Oppia nitens TaxID=1686743 RepID=UPI0023DB6975|nr:5'-nucleotidase-like [Oppia nitens]